MAQLVERRVRNAKARGSNPLISTMRATALLVATKRKHTRASFSIAALLLVALPLL